jgi:hypothetical protein
MALRISLYQHILVSKKDGLIILGKDQVNRLLLTALNVWVLSNLKQLPELVHLHSVAGEGHFSAFLLQWQDPAWNFDDPIQGFWIGTCRGGELGDLLKNPET